MDFKEMLKDYPEFLTSEHLVKLGLYASIDAAYQARRIGVGPRFIKMKHLVLYPKGELVKFLEEGLA